MSSLLLLLLLLPLLLVSAINLHKSQWNEGDGLFGQVSLAIFSKQYTSVHVGNPGKTMVLRLRWDQNVSYIYDAFPELFSDTIGGNNNENELFYLNDVCIRLSVIYNIEPPDLRRDTAESVTAGGSLGLGPDSDIWRYWSSFTVSKYTLTLGGTMDRRDCSDSPSSTTTVEFLMNEGLTGTIPTIALNATATTQYPVQLRLYEEFTYVPAVLLAAIENSKEQRTHFIVTRSYEHPELLLALANSNSLEFVISLRLNYVITPYNSRENIMRITETNLLKPLYGVSIGRITLLEDAVLYVDMATGRAILSCVYDSFPRLLSSSVSSTSDNLSLLSFVSILVWVWFYLETHPMLFQWTKERCFALLRLLPATTTKKKRHTGKVNNAMLSERAFVKRFTELYAAIDSVALSVVIHMTRLLVFWSCYIALAGYRTWRFVGRITLSIGASALVGYVMFYSLIGSILVLTALVNDNFVRRYPGASVSFVHFSLLITVWLNLLSEANVNNVVDMLISLSISTLALVRLMEWPFWLIFRMPDWTVKANTNLESTTIAMPSPLKSAVLFFVCTLFIPGASTFLVVCNVLPTIDLLWPKSSVRIVAALFYFIAVPLCMAFSNVARLFLLMHRDTTEKLVRTWESFKDDFKKAASP